MKAAIFYIYIYIHSNYIEIIQRRQNAQYRIRRANFVTLTMYTYIYDIAQSS